MLRVKVDRNNKVSGSLEYDQIRWDSRSGELFFAKDGKEIMVMEFPLGTMDFSVTEMEGRVRFRS